jgi:iron only hydrogenase large subunit-like protein
MMRGRNKDVDSVLTVRELARLIRLNGIDVTNIEKELADEPMSGEVHPPFLLKFPEV